jgi:nicotinamidase-related amidase
MPLDSARTALLLMDFQPAILGALSDADALVAQAAKVRALARAAGVTVVHVRVAFTRQDRAAIPERNKTFAHVRGTDYLDADGWAAQVHSELCPDEDDIVVTKTRFGAFSTTNLAQLLSGHDIDTLILAGVSTSGVVLSTVREAADRDYRLLVLRDCCADPDTDVHGTLLEHVFPRQADVVDTAALAEMLQG